MLGCRGIEFRDTGYAGFEFNVDCSPKNILLAKISHTLIFSNAITLKPSNPESRTSYLECRTPKPHKKSPETEIPRLYSKNKQQSIIAYYLLLINYPRYGYL